MSCTGLLIRLTLALLLASSSSASSVSESSDRNATDLEALIIENLYDDVKFSLHAPAYLALTGQNSRTFIDILAGNFSYSWLIQVQQFQHSLLDCSIEESSFPDSLFRYVLNFFVRESSFDAQWEVWHKALEKQQSNRLLHWLAREWLRLTPGGGLWKGEQFWQEWLEGQVFDSHLEELTLLRYPAPCLETTNQDSGAFGLPSAGASVMRDRGGGPAVVIRPGGATPYHPTRQVREHMARFHRFASSHDSRRGRGDEFRSGEQVGKSIMPADKQALVLQLLDKKDLTPEEQGAAEQLWRSGWLDAIEWESRSLAVVNGVIKVDSRQNQGAIKPTATNPTTIKPTSTKKVATLSRNRNRIQAVSKKVIAEGFTQHYGRISTTVFPVEMVSWVTWSSNGKRYESETGYLTQMTQTFTLSPTPTVVALEIGPEYLEKVAREARERRAAEAKADAMFARFEKHRSVLLTRPEKIEYWQNLLKFLTGELLPVLPMGTDTTVVKNWINDIKETIQTLKGARSSHAQSNELLTALELLGRGEDPVTLGIERTTENLVRISYDYFPEETRQILNALSHIATVTDATVEFIDDSTGNLASALWHKLDEPTRVRILGAGKVLSVLVPVARVKALAELTRVPSPALKKDGWHPDSVEARHKEWQEHYDGREDHDYQGISGYVPAPEKLKAYPDATREKRKTPVQGGGQVRARWKDSKGNIYEWDYQHGSIEKYDKRGKHLGEYDPNTGKPLKKADSTRRVEP
ncbi:colicin E3/pyocin S6 family cytotoxin [Endozoicomonas gorgoniicola]|uniref:Colicin E3/pyocin S6 family cytotoxin n=1 Tax=Endozoicomonas gorgoniicola TaxID=1234144 RepID=A0ABT3MYQ6_9GAMM|nr:colicin E3/pyocin S6 family cytotoxin [Endozoicomonas gorgoniicola]MCW7554510.1 colicin E3/pyocin S6 family cytotoxin [Endozoicomonas gorgoniicola]